MSSKPPRLFRHHRSLRQRGYYSHNTDVKIMEKPTRCPRCNFIIPRGKPAYRSEEGEFLCVVCSIIKGKKP